MALLLGSLIIAATIVAVARRVEVRLVLILAALAMALAAGADKALHGDGWAAFAEAPMRIVRVFVATFSNEKFVVPICSAMGFAFVLRETGCDQHLVRLLTRPFERVRPLLVPGTVVVGFLVNVPLVSQTSTAVAVGTVLVPLLRASQLSAVTIGAALVLGSSIGGELLNPAAPELRTVAEGLKTEFPGASSRDCVAHVNALVWWELLVVTGVFWLISWWAERSQPVVSQSAEPEAPAFRVNPLKAVIPFIPLVILFLTSPALHILDVPVRWLADPAKQSEVDALDSRLIGAAMLVGVLAAALTAPKTFRNTAATFFEGAGYGFAHIIGLIVAATCFGEGIKLIGLAALVGEFIAAHPGWLIPLAALLPLGFGVLSGSGMAATQSLFGFFVDPIKAVGADPFQVGAVVSLGAAAGRSTSPVSAVNLMASRMAGTDPLSISRRVAIPALAGLATVIALAMAR
jgi:DcuC family C4-dicarboxylate transporter